MYKPEKAKTPKLRSYLLLHLLLLLYSLGGVCSKFAGRAELFSSSFFLFYGLVLLDMCIYAVVWQQILKKMPLVTAYANKAVTVIWGLIWGLLIFGEQITIQKIIGIFVIFIGILLVVYSDE